MLDKKTLNVYSIIIGIFFLISGAGKAIDTAAFGNLISQYGFKYLMVLSPFIAVSEILIGLFLIFLIRPRRYSLYSFVLLLIFTLAFTYAHFTNGVDDCGCFGTLQKANIPPLFSFIRNIILLAMALVVFLKYPREESLPVKWKNKIILTAVCIFIFISGFTYRFPAYLSPGKETHKYLNQNIKSTELAKYLQTSSNKKYLFFCFSYTCPHCWNSIENLRQFKRNAMVDSIVVLATGEPADKTVFENTFKPDFPIRDLSAEAMDELTDAYPTAFYIERDTIKVVIQSVLPSPYTFNKYYLTPKSD